MMFAEREIRIVFAELSVVEQSNAICAVLKEAMLERGNDCDDESRKFMGFFHFAC